MEAKKKKWADEPNTLDRKVEAANAKAHEEKMECRHLVQNQIDKHISIVDDLKCKCADLEIMLDRETKLKNQARMGR